MKILIADDEPLSRRVLQSFLAKWGYEVVSVEDGNAAWEQLQAPEAPRVALLDWMMPGMNGVDSGNCDVIGRNPILIYF